MTAITIAIASGKGGTGKTFISTNLFNSLQNSGLNMALVDCDAEAPNDREFFQDAVLQNRRTVTQKVPVIDKSKCTYCGKCDEYCNFNAIFFLEEPPTIEVLEELCHVTISQDHLLLQGGKRRADTAFTCSAFSADYR
jgi:MinD superfamily P-loop ATPase